MRIGYKLATEGFPPKELIRQAVLAERAGFDFVEMSDHYHPWVEAQGHSAFAAGGGERPAMRPARAQLRRHPAFGSARR